MPTDTDLPRGRKPRVRERQFSHAPILSGWPLTTGQIARWLRVAPRTVCKWIDRGYIRGYRLPMSLDRRVRAGDFVAFCTQHGFDVPPELRGSDVLGFCVDLPGIVLKVAESEGEFGMLAASMGVRAVVLGDGCGLATVARLVTFCQKKIPAADVFFAVSADSSLPELLATGADLVRVFRMPGQAADLGAAVAAVLVPESGVAR